MTESNKSTENSGDRASTPRSEIKEPKTRANRLALRFDSSRMKNSGMCLGFAAIDTAETDQRKVVRDFHKISAISESRQFVDYRYGAP
jgi:hypothetical protein